jgi:predicted unusual protein kinase regulating ubiquinone biosynthesis (AarF/ABC1/UbiB family)
VNPSDLVAAASPANASRYAALVRLLLRHGRSDLVSGADLDEYAVDDLPDEGDRDQAERFAADLESMGPTYIKLGQLLSTRVDLLPAAYTEALTRLQDTVEPFPAEQVREIIEAELDMSVRHLFEDFDDEPLAAASLGQVHRATLPGGRPVVVKVQRPDVRETVRDDMEVLTKLAELADSKTHVGKRYGFAQLLRQFQRSLADELDYKREARNLVKLGDLTSDYDLLVVPQPVPTHSTSRVLTMDRVEGTKVTDVGPLGLMDYDTTSIADQLFKAYLKMILDDGFLHADPHPGNLMLTDDGRLALLDLGMVAVVPPRLQGSVVKLMLAIADGNGEEAALVLAEMGHPLEGYDAAAFRDDVSHLVSSAVNDGSEFQAGTALMELSRMSGAHGLRPPAEMSMIGKALLNLDQATMHLDPDFAPAEVISGHIHRIMASGLKTSPGGMLSAALEAKEFTTQLPRRANRILDTLAEGEFHLQVDAIDEERLLVVMQRIANRVVLGIVIAATILGAALLMRVPSDHTIAGYPAIAMLCFLVALVGGVLLSAWILVSDRRIAKKAREAKVRHGLPR